MPVLTAVATLGALTLALASLLVIANRRLHVAEDPRIDAVEDLLPHVNCGACGFPGCRPFAEAVVGGDALPGKCSVGSPADHERIAALLGVDVGAEEKRVARLACAGGDHVASRRAHYHGLATCGAAALVGGGGKACAWGCLGLGDCDVACTFDAIHMDAHGLPVVDEVKCTACGDCVDACPKDLFSLHPISHRLWVACRSALEGDAALAECAVACTACGRCAMDAPGLVTMRGALPVVDPAVTGDPQRAIARCPTGAIVWLDPERGPVKGPAAAKIVRRSPLPVAPG